MQIQKPTTTSLTISHIDYSPSGDVILMWCKIENKVEEKVENNIEKKLDNTQ
jgi:hypothetical protein